MSRHARHASRSSPGAPLLALTIVAIAGVTAGVLFATGVIGDVNGGGRASGPTTSPRPAASPTPTSSPDPEPTASPSPTPEPSPGPINTSFTGMTTFRGNATRSWYGEGPIPDRPVVAWRYPPEGGLCSTSSDQHGERLWCGTGWTGQPNVVVDEDGEIEVRFNAYDGAYHFLDGRTGEPVRAKLQTGDLAKGSATSDPDGYPLYYAGSRDDYLRVVALDRGDPEVLWQLNSQTSVPNPIWNSDWDGAPLVIDDYLLEGGENSWFYVIELNRDYDRDGLVTVDPRVVLTVPGYDDELFSVIPDSNVSIESSVAFHDGVAYFANSGGLVQGWDISRILNGGRKAERVFRFWTGEDTDASVVVDEDGFLYVASELERGTSRAAEVGQLMKLDPTANGDRAIVWSFPITERGAEGAGGAWATPALYGDMVYIATNYGDLIALDGDTGREAWRIHLPGPTWSSPVPIDDVLIQGDCAGTLHAYDISNPRREPPELWTVDLGSCVESTPSVLEGMIWVGTRGGAVYGIADRRDV
ncbi:MAG TPA: PQQ-binding-like beta-propeller repeat protein [Actinomycetota bacterium]|nr:PQQ-binding-like beta-propeller repeat protein [Actinomycetota bacterium]